MSELVETFQQFMPYILFVFGLLLGSFANVIILRLPEGKSFVAPRSACPKCQKQISWYDNIPVFSFVFLGGKCRSCKTRISVRYPIVELLMAALFALCGQYFGVSWFLLEALVFTFGLVVVSFIDLDHFILPDRFTIPGIVVGLLGAAINPERTFFPSLMGVIMGGGLLWAIAYFYFVWKKEDGMGGGDIKLLAWIGAVLGWKAIPFVVLSSSILGTLIGVSFSWKHGKGLKTVIPFGPYLALGAVLYMFAGQELADWYFGLFIPQFQ